MTQGDTPADNTPPVQPGPGGARRRADEPQEGTTPIPASLDPAHLDPSSPQGLWHLTCCAADGELEGLPESVQSAYLAHRERDPALADVEAEQRAMRRAVGRCMAEHVCPPALRQSVERLLAGADAEHQADAEPARRRLVLPWAWLDVLPAGRGLAAAAALVVLVVIGGMLVRGPVGVLTSPDGSQVQQAGPSGLVLAGFMSREHDRCAMHPDRVGKFTEHDLDRVPVAFKDVLGGQVDAKALRVAEARFLAAGRCKVPGKGPSVHLLYQAHDDSGRPVEVSLYVQRCCDPRFEEGKAYALGSTGDQHAAGIIGWRQGELVFYLVTDSPSTTRRIAQAMRAPALAGAL